MPDWQQAAEELRLQELPLVELYERLARTAPSGTARKLAENMLANQRFQVASLDLLQGEIPDEFECFGVITHDRVNVREGPGSKFAQTSEINRGTRVIVRFYEGFWVALQFADGTRGYVFKDYVKCELGT